MIACFKHVLGSLPEHVWEFSNSFETVQSRTCSGLEMCSHCPGHVLGNQSRTCSGQPAQNMFWATIQNCFKQFPKQFRDHPEPARGLFALQLSCSLGGLFALQSPVFYKRFSMSFLFHLTSPAHQGSPALLVFLLFFFSGIFFSLVLLPASANCPLGEGGSRQISIPSCSIFVRI